MGVEQQFHAGKNPKAEAESLHVPENVQKINKSFRKLILTQGGPMDIAYKNCENTRKARDELGVKYEYEENAQEGHSWGIWRADLYNLAQRIFK